MRMAVSIGERIGQQQVEFQGSGLPVDFIGDALNLQFEIFFSGESRRHRHNGNLAAMLGRFDQAELNRPQTPGLRHRVNSGLPARPVNHRPRHFDHDLH